MQARTSAEQAKQNKACWNIFKCHPKDASVVAPTAVQPILAVGTFPIGHSSSMTNKFPFRSSGCIGWMGNIILFQRRNKVRGHSNISVSGIPSPLIPARRIFDWTYMLTLVNTVQSKKPGDTQDFFTCLHEHDQRTLHIDVLSCCPN